MKLAEAHIRANGTELKSRAVANSQLWLDQQNKKITESVQSTQVLAICDLEHTKNAKGSFLLGVMSC